MKRLEEIKNVYFLGIGGIGMSALARWFRQEGARVSGYDRNPGKITRQLQAIGIDIHFEDKPSLIPENLDLAIYTPAIPTHSLELEAIREGGIPLMKRAEVLGRLSQDKDTIAIAGTHGKTSITSLIAWLFHCEKKAYTAFIGGLSRNLDTNMVSHPGAHILIAEADEFDRSFLQLRARTAVISAMDADHLDVYGDRESMQLAYRQFANGLPSNGTLLLQSKLPSMYTKASLLRYGAEENNDCHFEDLHIEDGHMHFSLVWKDEKHSGMQLGVPGRHNLENALAACAVALCHGIRPETIREALKSYQGVERRFDYRIRRNDCIYIDDYAHHPEEISALVNSVRELYPGKKISGIFQPHLYSRTRDFAEGFARSLDLLDEVILMDIYPAREQAIPDVDSGMILRRMQNKQRQWLTRTEILQKITRHRPEILLTIGAGDIDLLVPEIEKVLTESPAAE